MVSVAFATLLESSNWKLNVEHAKIVQTSLLSWYNVICSDARILALVLHPAVDKSRYPDNTFLLGGGPYLQLRKVR